MSTATMAKPRDTGILAKERATFEEKKPELLGTSEGRWALVYGSDVVGTYDSSQDAIRDGYSRFGNVAFLVKQIVAVESPENFVSNHLAF